MENPNLVDHVSRVFIIDDHPIVRQGLAQLINREPDLAVIGDAADADTALELLASTPCDIVILDLSLNGPDGLDLLKIIRDRLGLLPVLILSMLDETIYAERTLRAGAQGYIMKQEATEKVLMAIRRILTGGIYVSDRIAGRVLDQFAARGGLAGQSPFASLTDREMEVFRLIGKGNSTRQIAEQLHISVKTVESYQAHIKDKLSLKNARELVQWAVRYGIPERLH